MFRRGGRRGRATPTRIYRKETMEVQNHELRTTREAMRELNALLEQLEQGSLEKVVLTRNGQFVGVLTSVAKWEDLFARIPVDRGKVRRR